MRMHKVEKLSFLPSYVTAFAVLVYVSHIMMTSLRSKWAAGCVACRLRIDLDMLVARALKNSQLTCGDVTIICETVH